MTTSGAPFRRMAQPLRVRSDMENEKMARSRMPCGHCDIGTYSVTPVLNGVAAFRGALTRKEALRRAPMCKTEPRKVCAGACDWLIGADFPITDERCAEIEAYCRT